MIETKIYVGLNDSETNEQKFETKKYLDILKKICQSYHTPFSISFSSGGYFYNDGTYTDETTLIITMIDVSEETANEIAKDICVFFHQESVMITYDEVKTIFISEKLER